MPDRNTPTPYEIESEKLAREYEGEAVQRAVKVARRLKSDLQDKAAIIERAAFDSAALLELSKKSNIGFFDRRKIRANIARALRDTKFESGLERILQTALVVIMAHSFGLYSFITKRKVDVLRATAPSGIDFKWTPLEKEIAELNMIAVDGVDIALKFEMLFGNLALQIRGRYAEAITKAVNVTDARDLVRRGLDGLIERLSDDLEKYLAAYFNEIYSAAIRHLRGTVKIKGE